MNSCNCSQLSQASSSALSPPQISGRYSLGRTMSGQQISAAKNPSSISKFMARLPRNRLSNVAIRSYCASVMVRSVDAMLRSVQSFELGTHRLTSLHRPALENFRRYAIASEHASAHRLRCWPTTVHPSSISQKAATPCSLDREARGRIRSQLVPAAAAPTACRRPNDSIGTPYRVHPSPSHGLSP